MRPLIHQALWLGHAGDGRDVSCLSAAGIAAVMDVADNEPPAALPREIAYFRFPASDGSDNPAWILRGAATLAAELIRQNVPTLICCSAGMSRSPAIAAAALAIAFGMRPEECLGEVANSGPIDVSPGLWRDILRMFDSRPDLPPNGLSQEVAP